MEKFEFPEIDFDPLSEVKNKFESQSKSPSERAAAIIVDLLSRPEKWYGPTENTFNKEGKVIRYPSYSYDNSIEMGFYKESNTYVWPRHIIEILGQDDSSKDKIKIAFQEFLSNKSNLEKEKQISELEKLLAREKRRNKYKEETYSPKKEWFAASVFFTGAATLFFLKIWIVGIIFIIAGLYLVCGNSSNNTGPK